MNEDILSRLALGEPGTLGRIEPLHHTLFSRQCSQSCIGRIPIHVLVTLVDRTEDPAAIWTCTPTGLQGSIDGGSFAQTKIGVEQKLRRNPGRAH